MTKLALCVVLLAACSEKREALQRPFVERAHMELAFIPAANALDENSVRGAFASLTAVARTEERQKYPGLADDALQYSAGSLSEADLTKMVKAKKVVVVQVSWPRTQPLALSQTYDAIAAVTSEQKALVYDRHAMATFTAESWRTQRLGEGWKGADHTAARAVGPAHYNVHPVQQDNGLIMLGTAGLARFGLRDLILFDVNRASVTSASALVSLAAQALIAGATLNAAGQLEVSVKGKLTLAFAEPDPKTAARRDAVVIGFVGLGCKEPGECLNVAISTLFGASDSVQNVKLDEAVVAASKRARTALEAFRLKIKYGLPPDETLLVKAGFPYANGREWMWVDVHAWDKTTLSGTLENDPQYVALKAGAAVEVQLEDVQDYMYKVKDGSFYGNEIGRVTAPQMFEAVGGGRFRVKQQKPPSSP